MLEMVTASSLFDGSSDIACIVSIFRLLGFPQFTARKELEGLPHWSPNFPAFRANAALPTQFAWQLGPEGEDLARQCLNQSSEDRIAATKAQEHAFCRPSSSTGASRSGPREEGPQKMSLTEAPFSTAARGSRQEGQRFRDQAAATDALAKRGSLSKLSRLGCQAQQVMGQVGVRVGGRGRQTNRSCGSDDGNRGGSKTPQERLHHLDFLQPKSTAVPT